MSAFGDHVRERREAKRAADPAFSLRKVAEAVGVEPSYLSKVERGIEAPPSEAKIVALAEALGEDQDVLLALAGKVASDVVDAIRKRPALFGRLVRELKNAPDHAVLRIVREVRDGNW
jgi:transcriptional regulator with XRE-family HTH domain